MAPGTAAPVASVTVPRIVPRKVCALPGAPASTISAIIISPKLNLRRFSMVFPSLGLYGLPGGFTSFKELARRINDLNSEKSVNHCGEKIVLFIFIFRGRIARADGIDILEKGRLIRIYTEVFPKFLVLGPGRF